jgi:hypothetical protein
MNKILLCMKGRREIVQMMLNFGATNYNLAMAYSTEVGHKKIVQMMLDLGANDHCFKCSTII